MSSDPSTAAAVAARLPSLAVRTAAMFGEYALYCDDKVVALICDDTVFLKPVGVDPELLSRTEPAPPMARSAKNYHRVPAHALEDHDWLARVVQATADALPPPGPRTARPHPPAKVPHPRRPTT